MSTDEDWKSQRDESKAMGDEAFKAGDYRGAILHYTRALSLDPDYAVALSNRSAAHLKNGEKSKALHDAQTCVKLGTMGIKGQSRLAAALQSLGRFEAALKEWNAILVQQADHPAALQGVKDCKQAMQSRTQPKEEPSAADAPEDEEQDELDAFFDEVEEVTDQVKQEKMQQAQPKATNAIRNQKKDLGTAHEQIERLLQSNYQWRNLNPFYVLDISHTASKEDISRRYKALSLLLHPDKNRDESDRAQLAYDQVLNAKEHLDDDGRYQHAISLVQEGLLMGERDYKKNSSATTTLEEAQSKAVMKIFAQVEQARREVKERTRTQEQREKTQEKEAEDQLRSERKRDNEWKQAERVEKRIGNWRDFQKKKKSRAE